LLASCVCAAGEDMHAVLARRYGVVSMGEGAAAAAAAAGPAAAVAAGAAGSGDNYQKQ
jgi:hypothetical protein